MAEPINIWFDQIDELAKQANDQMTLALRASTNGSGPDIVTANALMAIAAQLAYGNVVAVATFYMQNRLLITPNQGEA